MSVTKRGFWAIAAAVVATWAAADAALAQGEGTSMFQMFFLSGDWLGLVITWLLLIMSTTGIAMVIYHFMQNRQASIMPDETVETAEELVGERRLQELIDYMAEDDSMYAEMVGAALAEAPNGFGAMERAIEESGDMLSARRIRSLEILNVLGAVGPMLGLFGTVYGMIQAFQAIVASGSSVKPADLAAGISTALVTTFWGLVVGIPAVAGYALIRNKVDGMAAEAMVRADELIGQLRPGKKKAGGEKAAPKPETPAEEG